MELSELPHLQQKESPQPNNTYRTLKPPDRCVISYNFEQTHSVNVTHNLLIGMFSDNTKKHNKHSAVSADKNKNKLFSILSNPKKIPRHDNKAISKVYDARVQPRKYVDAVSPREDGPNGGNTQQVGQKTLMQNNQNYIENYSKLQSEEQNVSRQQFRASQLLKPKGFDEKHERQVSPYRKRPNVLKQNVVRGSRLQNQLDGSRQRTELYESGQEQNGKDGLQVKNVSSSISVSKVRPNISQHNKLQPHSEYHHYNKENKHNHLGKQFADSHQFQLNQPLLQQHQSGIAQQLQPVSQKPSVERISNQSQPRIPSRKEIQDQQLRQLQEIVRKQQALNFKKNHFKIADSNKELLPFNAEIDPYRHQPTKHIKRTNSAKKIPNNQLTSMTEANSYHRAQKAGKRDTNNKNETNSRGVFKNGGEKIGGKQNYSMQKHSSIAMSKQSSIAMSKQSSNKAGMPSIHQIRQSKAKQFSLNELSKYNKNIVSPTTNNPQQSQTTTALKKVHTIKNNTNSTNLTLQTRPDVTENNVIKGFKVAAAPQLRTSNSGKGNSFSMTKQGSDNKITQLNAQPHSKINRQQTEHINNKQPNREQSQIVSENNETKSKNNRRINDQQKQSNKLSNENTSRTVKLNKNRPKPSKSTQTGHPQHNTSKTEQSQTSPIKPTIARTPKDKSYHFKNWKESQLEKAMKESKDSKKRRQSQQSRDKKISNTNKVSNMKPKRKEKSAEIDLDAEEQDKFGLLAHKNVTINKNKKNKKKESKKVKKDEKRIGSIKEESEQSIKQSSEDNCSQAQEHKSQEDSEQGSVYQASQESVYQASQESVYQPSQMLQHSIQKEQNYKRGYEKQKSIRNQSTVVISPSNKINLPISNKEQTTRNEQELMTQKGQQLLKREVRQGEQVINEEGVHQIQQLIQQNGELSRIQSVQEQVKQNINNNNPHPQEYSSRVKEEHPQKQEYSSVAPINTKRNSNLQELLIATEELPPQYKISEPMLQQVQRQFAWSREQIEPNPQQQQALHKTKQQTIKKKVNEHQKSERRQQEKIMKQQDKLQNSGEEMEVNLPVPDLVCTHQTSAIRKIAQQNQTDYHEEQRDRIDSIAGQDRKEEIGLDNKQEINKTQDFFAHNLKELSKMTDLANLTNYQPIDKNIVHYTRAPILSFLYQMPNQFSNYNQPFIASSQTHKLLVHLKETEEIGVQAFDQAISILLSIDSWIIQRVFEPFENKDGKIGIWLYCQGKWTLFLQNKDNNFRTLLYNATAKAINLLGMKMQLENVLRLISGVRIVRLKSSKKRVFNQLQFSLKKGHTLKALTSKQSKWGERLFTVSNVQVTKDHQNVLQIKEQNQTYWVKQTKFKQLFQYFLLICTRKSHFWTNRIIQHKPEHKTVITISSQVPAHGSITLFYPSTAPSSLLLYKQLQSKVLKFMGKIEQKSNQNGNLYFEFRLHGRYCIFLQTPQTCNLAVQSTSQLQISEPQYILSHNLKNNSCEYVQLNTQTRRKNNLKQSERTGEMLSKLREKFIKLVVEK